MDKRTFVALKFFGDLSTESIEALNLEGGYNALALKYAAQKACNDRLRAAAKQPDQRVSTAVRRTGEIAALMGARMPVMAAPTAQQVAGMDSTFGALS